MIGILISEYYQKWEKEGNTRQPDTSLHTFNIVEVSCVCTNQDVLRTNNIGNEEGEGETIPGTRTAVTAYTVKTEDCCHSVYSEGRVQTITFRYLHCRQSTVATGKDQRRVA